MDGLGKTCFSEICNDVTYQSGEAAIACTKAQQAKEDVGTSNCAYNNMFPIVVMVLSRLTGRTGLKEIPGGVKVM